MSTLAWLCLTLGLLAVLPAARFVARAWRFRAAPTVRAVVIGQLAGLALILGFALLAPRADLGGLGWFGLALAALTVPLALGDLLQSHGGMRVVAGILTGATAVVAVGVGALTLPQTLQTVTVAGHAIPLTEKNVTLGAQLTVDIPPTASGFHPRRAVLYIPAGWLRDPSSTRPVVTMMMGQPGHPAVDPTVDAIFALGQERLDDAPFVLDVDQLGAEDKNPPCADTSAGKVETYVTKDVPAWIRANLPVSGNRLDWGIAGYSHGGECAAYFGAKYPQTWANVLSIGGPDKPGEYRWQDLTLKRYWHGDLAAYEKTWPANVLAHTDYADLPMRGIFIAGGLDEHFKPQVEATATAAEKAGWKVTYWAVPNATHTQALEPGLQTAYNQLIPRWVASGAVPQTARSLCSPDQTPHACGLTQAATVAGVVTIGNLSVLGVFLGVQLVLFFARRGRRGVRGVEVEAG